MRSSPERSRVSTPEALRLSGGEERCAEREAGSRESQQGMQRPLFAQPEKFALEPRQNSHKNLRPDDSGSREKGLRNQRSCQKRNMNKTAGQNGKMALRAPFEACLSDPSQQPARYIQLLGSTLLNRKGATSRTPGALPTA